MSHTLIRTERLIIRLPSQTDADAIIDYFKTNESHLSAFEPSKPDGFYTHDFWETKINSYLKEASEGRAIRLFLFNTSESEIVGTLEFSQIARGPFQACYLGFGVAKKFEGQGFMREGVGAAIEYAFGTLNLHRIMANHLPDNSRSEQLLRRLGFVKECVAKDYLRINGQWRDHVLNSLTNQKWRAGDG